MKERPIIFSAPMVRAILDGRKTMTRRMLKPQPSTGEDLLLWWNWSKSQGSASIENPGLPSSMWLEHCPYGQPGDRLWVRETHAIVPRTAYRCSEGVQQVLRPYDVNDAAIFREGFDRSYGGIRWRPPIHMPRWASRITLEITDVYVERLQDISEADAVAEGIQQCEGGAMDYLANDYEQGFSPKSSFRSLWESINGAGSWNANPWVWVVEFKRIMP